MPRLALTFLLFTLGVWSVILSAETCPSLMHHRCMYTWSRDICATSLCHLRLPEERLGEAVLVDVGRQDVPVLLRLVPENSGGRRELGQGCLQAHAGSSFLAWLFHNVSPCLDVGVSCRGEEDRGEEVKKLLNAWSPRRSPLQAAETQVALSSEESKMTRRSLNHLYWAEGWEVERILYARDPQSGDRKVDVVSFFACMQL